MSDILQIETPPAFLPLLERAKYKGAYGGRGSGKSHFFAEYLVEECLDDPTTRAVCVREIQKSLDQSVKQLITDKIALLGVEDFFEVLDTEIHVLDDEGERAGIIIFMGMQNHTADSIKSLEGYRIAWVEEAQSLSQKSLNLLTPTLRRDDAQIWFSWNPRKASDPVDVFMRGEDATNDNDIICVEVNYVDNPWFEETSLAKDMQRDQRRDPDKYAHVWLGGYEHKSGARVFHNWKTKPFDTPDDAVRRFGADWGFSIDPKALISMFIGRWENGKAVSDQKGDVLFIDREAYKVGCEIDETPSLFAGTDKQKPERWKNEHGHPGIPGVLDWQITGDSSSPETISYLRRLGFKIMPAVKGARSIEEGVEFLKSFDIVIHPRCTNAINEFTLYSFKIDPDTEQVIPVLDDKDNHVIDAARYALEALRRARKPAAPSDAKPDRRDYKAKRPEEGSGWQAM